MDKRLKNKAARLAGQVKALVKKLDEPKSWEEDLKPVLVQAVAVEGALNGLMNDLFTAYVAKKSGLGGKGAEEIKKVTAVLLKRR
jgi:DNA-binding FrmR family transcriptional regulator